MSYIQAELDRGQCSTWVLNRATGFLGRLSSQASLGLQADFSMAGRPMFARADIAPYGEYYNNLQQSGLAAVASPQSIYPLVLRLMTQYRLIFRTQSDQ